MDASRDMANNEEELLKLQYDGNYSFVCADDKTITTVKEEDIKCVRILK